MAGQFEYKGTVWSDATSYSRGDTVRNPTLWETNVRGFRVAITNGYINYRPEWVFHCRVLGFDTYHLKNAATKEDAAELALRICRIKAKELYEAFK